MTGKKARAAMMALSLGALAGGVALVPDGAAQGTDSPPLTMHVTPSDKCPPGVSLLPLEVEIFDGRRVPIPPSYDVILNVAPGTDVAVTGNPNIYGPWTKAVDGGKIMADCVPQ